MGFFTYIAVKFAANKLRKGRFIIAWVKNEWLSRARRQELIDEYSTLIDTLLVREKAGQFTDEDYVELDGYLEEQSRLKRIHRAEVDLLYFALEYFSETKNPDNSANWDGFDLQSTDDAPDFHREICADIDEVSNVVKNAKIAEAAPRSHAKSSYLTKANPIREIAFRKRKYIIIISETPTVATANLEWISGQLKSNEKLRNDFGPLLSPKQNINPKDNSSEFITWVPKGDDDKRELTLVQAASSGQALRGRSWGGTRPDLVVCDDLEDLRSNAGTKEQRDKLKDWFSSVVMPIGDPKGLKTAFIVMGTVVHEDSLLNDLLKNRADFKSKRYKAIIEEPTRNDLWDECKSLYLDVETPKNEREENARRFYEANKVEMDEGAVVLWEEVQPLFKLLTWKWANGSKAFNTEYQNEPRDEESQIFNPDTFRYYDESDLIDEHGAMIPLDYYAFWDVAAGKSSRTDYNAIVTIGRNRRTGVIYIVDAWAQKCRAHVALKVALEKIKIYQHRTFAVETIGIGFDMERQLQNLVMKEKVYSTRITAISYQGTNKEKRIEALEPLCESGFLRFKKKHSLLLEQLEQFPSGQHDDVADSLAGAINQTGGLQTRRTHHRKPRGL